MSKHITSAISQTFGKFASKEFPLAIQTFINKAYIGLMGLDMGEFKEAEDYPSLNALFTRKLQKDREYSLDESVFISPCDSWISECGEIKRDLSMQIKGRCYSVDEFLGEDFDDGEKAVVHDGTFINFYLSPKDYHRYHMPCDLKVLKAVHIPGKFYPVNIPSLKKRINLFIENERVVLKCQTKDEKIFYMVLVSALNVGVMQVSFEERIKTNADANFSSVYEYENLEMSKGEDFGCFEMGSTIVVLAQKDMLELDINQNDNVRYGQSIAKLK